MEPLAQQLLAFLSATSFVGGLVYFVRVRLFTMGSKKEIITALTVMGISAIVFALTI